MVDSVSANLYASSAYGKVQNQEINVSPKDTSISANNFQNMVEVNFNSFASMSPSQILAKISASAPLASSSAAYRLDLSSMIAGEISKTREALSRQEKQAQKAALGEANIVELMTASNQASVLLSTFVSLKDSAEKAWKDIWSMTL